jgi:protein SCO1/2
MARGTLFWRIAPLIAGIALLVTATALVNMGGRLPFARPTPAAGLDLGGAPAPNFRLTDQSGTPVALADLRGKVVVLTFLYTTCPDICPVIAWKMGQVHDGLGARADDVAFVAVTVDPERDSPPRLQQYLAAQRLQDKLTFLTSDRPTLERVWAAYYVGVTQGKTVAGGDGTIAGYEVLHSDSLFLIDRQGRERRLLHADIDPAVLRADVEGLLGARGAVPAAEGATGERGGP